MFCEKEGTKGVEAERFEGFRGINLRRGFFRVKHSGDEEGEV